MSHNIETELKVLLSKEEFERLAHHFNLSSEPTIIQRNTYYDTNDLSLKLANTALRLRNFAASSEWTIKQRQDAFRSLELNQTNALPILPVPSEITKTDIHSQDLLSFLSSHQIDLTALKQTYDIMTERWNVVSEVGEYALDRSHFLDTTDYELEFETEDLELAQQTFKKLLEQLNISYQPAPTKISRAVQYAAQKSD